MDKFEPKVKPGGVLIYDPNGIVRPPSRSDIRVYSIDATPKRPGWAISGFSTQ